MNVTLMQVMADDDLPDDDLPDEDPAGGRAAS